MILILSENDDVSTDYTIEWFHHLDIPFIRLNTEDLRNSVAQIEFKDSELQVFFIFKGQKFSLNEIKGVWFRRSFLDFKSGFFESPEKGDEIVRQVYELLNRENETLISFLVTRLTQLRSLNSQQEYNANKLQSLLYAQKAGLNIPQTLIATDKHQVHNVFGEGNENIVCKPIQDNYDLEIEGLKQRQYIAGMDFYGPLPDQFYYSLFQQKLDKKYELRIFFIQDRFYACALFTKSSLGQQIRNGNEPVRMVPFSLPEHVRLKLLEFAALSGLNSGSIDMVVDKNNDYFFLEVNPVGQFGYISRPCNFYLHREIATFFKHG